LRPQQLTVPSVFNPQECCEPTTTCEKVPKGGVDCPEKFHPQRDTPVFAALAVKSEEGGAAEGDFGA